MWIVGFFIFMIFEDKVVHVLPVFSDLPLIKKMKPSVVMTAGFLYRHPFNRAIQ